MTQQQPYTLNWRDAFKAALWHERKISTGMYKKPVPICPICLTSLPSLEESHLHEWLITKRKAQGSSLPEDVLNHRINCVFRHEVCPNGKFHAPGAESIMTRALCYAQIYYFYGDEPIEEWIAEVAEHSQGIAQEATGVLALVRDHVEHSSTILLRSQIKPTQFKWGV